MTLTPYEIEIVLHYYYSPEEHPECAGNSPAWRSSVDMLLAEGVLQLRKEPSQYGATYESTERSRVYIEALKDVPLPVQKWVMP